MQFELPAKFTDWFDTKNWQPRPHQLQLLANAEVGSSTLLIAPTGAGKTLAGFLPSLVALSKRAKRKPGTKHRGIHTLYISPLKALAVDIKRNLETPIAEMGLSISIETRTSDTAAHRKQRQKLVPPDILLTTPEQVSLLLSASDADRYFEDLETVIFDELHSLVTSKRGQLLSLALSRLWKLAPQLKTIGLSATVSKPEELQEWLVPQNRNNARDDEAQTGKARPRAELIEVAGGAKPDISILKSSERIPWAGHSARYAIGEVLAAIANHKMTLLFVNTRSQAEMLFQELWKINGESLAIALHHGSLDVGQRRRVEAAMIRGELRAIVATSTLDLGIDWGDVDLVVHVGAPKGASRLAQRIGRSNHRMNEPSKAILVPANRFEVMECQAALDANYLGSQDTPPLQNGNFDVLAQHIMGMACSGPFYDDDLYDECRSAAPYASLARRDFDRVLDFVASGGYALRAYDQYAKIRKMEDGRWRLSHPRLATQYRLNAGTIIDAPLLDVRLVRHKTKKKNEKPSNNFRGGMVLGKIEEGFIESLVAGDTFLFAGRTLRFEGMREASCYASQASESDARIPVYAGGRFPLSTHLAERVRQMIANEKEWTRLPDQVSKWLKFQQTKSCLPHADELLVETFPRDDRHYIVLYPFEGRMAHQTLGMLLTRRLERRGAKPLGFVATEYALAIWGLADMSNMIEYDPQFLNQLFDADMLGDDLEAWLDESYLLKRTFRQVATIAGLIEKRHPGKEKSGRQMTVSSDLIYDVLRSHQADHILLEATRNEVASGLLDVHRLSDMLARIGGRLVHKPLEEISPLAVPVMMEIGRETILGEAQEMLMAEAAQDLADEAMNFDYD